MPASSLRYSMTVNAGPMLDPPIVAQRGEPSRADQDPPVSYDDGDAAWSRVPTESESDLITMLRERVAGLEQELSEDRSNQEIKRIEREWQTSERLLEQSQRDNEIKHDMIEQYKLYVKDMERILLETLGVDWKERHEVRMPLAQSTAFSSSTPLPRPAMATLGRPTSVLSPSKRVSRPVNRPVSLMYSARKARDLTSPSKSVDETPAGAMRRLLGAGEHFQTINPPVNVLVHQDTIERRTDISNSTKSGPIPSTAKADTLDAGDAQYVRQLASSSVRTLAPTANDMPSVAVDSILEYAKHFVGNAEDRATEREQRLQRLLEELKTSRMTGTA